MENRTIFIVVVIFAVVGCLALCCMAVLGTGAGVWFLSADADVPMDESLEGLPNSDDETAADAYDGGSAVDGEIPADVVRQMETIEMQVILGRGLEPDGEFHRTLYSAEQLRQKVMDDFYADYSPEEAEIDAVTLAAFGLLNPDFDLYNFYIELLSEQIAGFYDDETKEMAVVQGAGFQGPERLTYAHEYVHALQDQNYDFDNGLDFNEEACEEDSERCAGLQALIEGDATLMELEWFLDNGTQEDREEIIEFYNSLNTPVYDSAPEFISLDFIFPYEKGHDFVKALHDQGGWGTVDRAYANPPLSTEQIMHPERYPDDAPVPVELGDFSGVLGAGWEEIDRGVMGEWYTYLILAKGLDEAARLRDSKAEKAVEGWGGDAYVVYYNAETDETMMVLHSTWDSAKDADEFADAFHDYAKNRFGRAADNTWHGEDGSHVFYYEDDFTTWILAPDAATAAAVWEMIP